LELYIANVTKQIVQFAYRAPERFGLVIQTIPIGGQIKVSPKGSQSDLSTPEIDSILEQHRKYGLISVEELDTNRSSFHGMCYCIGKPISVDRIHKAMQRNEETLEELGKTIRKEAALAVNNQIENTVGGNLKQLEMSVVEEEPRGGYTDDHKPLGEGVRIIRESNPNSGGGNEVPFGGRKRKNG
jgi:hypothetical protein